MRPLLFSIAYRLLGSAMDAEDAVLRSDGGGKVHEALRPIAGASAVARFLLGVPRKVPADFRVVPTFVNGELGTTRAG